MLINVRGEKFSKASNTRSYNKYNKVKITIIRIEIRVVSECRKLGCVGWERNAVPSKIEL